MPAMPSAETRAIANSNSNAGGSGAAGGIGPKDVEGLVMEIKENLRLSATTMKAVSCSHLSRKSSRASPYKVPGRTNGRSYCCDPKRRAQQLQPAPDAPEDPYELLQRLLRDGSLVNEAVRRVQLGLTPKQRYFYESDEESSPVLRLCSQEN